MKNSIKFLLILTGLLCVNEVTFGMQYPYHRRGDYSGRGQAIPAVATQGIQRGNLIIHNTLPETVQWNVSMRLDGVIPGMGSVRNSSASASGYIAANSAGQLSSGAIAPGVWSSTINLTLKRPSSASQMQRQIQQLGTYVLRLDDRGNLVLERQQ